MMRCLVSLVLLVPLCAGALAAVTVPAQAAKPGVMRVAVVAPKGVAAKVRVAKGKQRVVVVKRSAGGSKVVKRKVAPGVYRVFAKPVASRGVVYVPRISSAKVKVRSGKTSKVKVVYRVAPAPTKPVAPGPIGSEYMGGIYVGTTQDDSGKKYALVASPRSMQFAPYAFDRYLHWDRYVFTSRGSYRHAPVKSDWDGLRNTQSASDADYQIFRYVEAMSEPNDGGSPWYVPAKNELNVLWGTLGESGLAFDYAKNGVTRGVWWLWSSTEYTNEDGDADLVWYQHVRGVDGGSQYDVFKDECDGGECGDGVRPVHRIAL